jgi:glycerophosphoryl diester phosphodiesterase
MRRLTLGFLVWAVACGSSSSEPTDPLATEYCAACSELESCERVVNEAIQARCSDETRSFYGCVIDNACDESACADEWETRDICMGRAPRDRVNTRILVLMPSANLGHRGTGPTREGNPYPENSVPSFLAAMDEGANGVELDAEITADGRIIVMHDDTLDRTTDCTGCVSEMTFDQVRACSLLDGEGNPTSERPPTLLEVYSALGPDALINVELKVFGEECRTETTDAAALVEATLAEVIGIGGEDQTIFSSFDETAVELIKTAEPGFYSALISQNPDAAVVERAIELNQDAIHPFFSVSEEVVQMALDAGLQVNVWTVNTAGLMQQQIDKGSTAIITDEPDILAQVLDEQPGLVP